jgi:alpha-1,2-mannosyltransferase
VPTAARLILAEKIGLGLLLLTVLAFGIVVEIRSAFQTMRRTDFGVYARAAWAVERGEHLYEVADNRGWHYCYPPPFAVLMVPFADPPPAEPRGWYLPFAVSVGVWYVFSLGCLWFALSRFSDAILAEPCGSRRWWTSRTWPLVLTGSAVGYTLARGQVNLLIVALVAGMFAAQVRGARFRSGLWLGAAIAIKVIPAFFGMYLLWKRDGRAMAGVLVALLVGLLLIPSAVWGVRGAIDLNCQMLEKVLQPGSMGDGDQTRAKELTNATATDSQSFQAFLHNWQHPDPQTRPTTVAAPTRLLHWFLGGTLTLGVLGWVSRRPRTAANELLVVGSLGVLMLHLTPVSHMHYYAYSLPLVCGLWLSSISQDRTRLAPSPPVLFALTFWSVATAMPLFPGAFAESLRTFGIGPFASLVLVLTACREMQPAPTTLPRPQPNFSRQAACRRLQCA